MMACRGAGKSYSAAISILLDSFHKPGIKSAVAGFILKQSNYVYQYCVDFLSVLQQKIGKKEAEKLWNISKGAIRFANGSIVAFFSGGKSIASLKGFRADVIYVDEGDLFSLEQFDGIANAKQSNGKWPFRFDVLSTNYTTDGDGVVLTQIQRYEEFNANRHPALLPCRVFRTCLLDVLAKCDDRFQCNDLVRRCNCELWDFCKGKAKEKEGFIQIPDAIATTLTNSRPTFEAQMLLLRPLSQHTYFHTFTQKNVLEKDRPIDPSLPLFITFDFGGGRAEHCAIVSQKTRDGTYYVVYEKFSAGHLEPMIDCIKQDIPNILSADCFYDPAGNRKDHIKDAKSHRDVLVKAGFRPRCRQFKRRPTFEALHTLIQPASGPPKFYLNPSCKRSIGEIQAARHQIIRGKIIPEPEDMGDRGGDEALDCIRMTIGWTKDNYAFGQRHSSVIFYGGKRKTPLVR